MLSLVGGLINQKFLGQFSLKVAIYLKRKIGSRSIKVVVCNQDAMVVSWLSSDQPNEDIVQYNI